MKLQKSLYTNQFSAYFLTAEQVLTDEGKIVENVSLPWEALLSVWEHLTEALVPGWIVINPSYSWIEVDGYTP